MSFLKARIIAPTLSLVLASGVFVQMHAFARQDETSDYHARVRAAADQIPATIGPWEGVDIRTPTAAGKLLRPNVIFSRTYKHRQTGRRANVIFIQCLDSRDMGGHYPPNCYPGNGWTQSAPVSTFEFPVWGRTIPVAVYSFTRADGSRSMNTVVYNFFVLPATGFVTSMEQVRAASGDYRMRPYGAAQVQVMVDAGTPRAQQLEIFRELIQPLGPAVELIQDTHRGETP
jgi:hypothetical protein